MLTVYTHFKVTVVAVGVSRGTYVSYYLTLINNISDLTASFEQCP